MEKVLDLHQEGSIFLKNDLFNDTYIQSFVLRRRKKQKKLGLSQKNILKPPSLLLWPRNTVYLVYFESLQIFDATEWVEILVIHRDLIIIISFL